MDECGCAIGADPASKRGTDMRTTRSGYLSQFWPFALAIALVVLAVLRAYGGAGAAREPLAEVRSLCQCGKP